jgi:hypothetical protein
MDDVVEIVARAMVKGAEYGDCDPEDLGTCPPEACECRQHARAVLAVLDEAGHRYAPFITGSELDDTASPTPDRAEG